MSDLVEQLRAYAKDQGGWHNIDDTCEEAADEIARLREENSRLEEAEAALAWFHINATNLKIDIRSAHVNRGSGATQWMREDDRDFRADLEKALERASAALGCKSVLFGHDYPECGAMGGEQG